MGDLWWTGTYLCKSVRGVGPVNMISSDQILNSCSTIYQNYEQKIQDKNVFNF